MKQSHLLVLGSLLTAAALSLAGCNDDTAAGQPVARRKAGSLTDAAKAAQKGFEKRPGNSVANQCYNEICKTKTTPELQALLKSRETPSPEIQNYYTTKLLPLLTQKSQNAQKLAQTRLTRLEAAEKNFQNISLNPAQDKTVKTVILLLKPEMLTDNVTKEAKTALQETDFQKAKNIYTVKKGPSYLQALHKDKTVELAAQAEAAYINATQATLNQVLNGSLLNVDGGSLKKATRQESLSNEDIEAISEAGYGIRLFDFFISGKGSGIFDKVQLKSEDILKLYQNSTVKQTLHKRIGSQTAVITSCEKSYYQTLNLYPQPSQLKSFQDKIEILRKEAVSLVGPQDPAHDKILSATFTYPKTPGDITKSWGTSLQEDMEYEPNETARIEKYDDATMFTLAVISSALPQDNNYLCGNLIDLDVSDKTLSTDASVKVSWLSVRYPQIGLAIVAHELGHIVDQFSTSFGNLQICLKDKHTSSIYAGEDFADWFSTKTMLELSKNEHIQTENFGCFFAASNETLSLKNSDAKDPHSSDLYRALQIHLQLGNKLPASCEALAKQEDAKATDQCQ